MANRKERRRSMKINELREQAIEALGQAPYIDLETDDPEVTVRVWHPLLVDDEAQVRLERFNTGDDLDKDKSGNPKLPHRIGGELAEPQNIRSARAILGPEEHAKFVANGGHSNDIQLAWNEMVRTHDEEDNVLSEAAVDEDPK